MNSKKRKLNIVTLITATAVGISLFVGISRVRREVTLESLTQGQQTFHNHNEGASYGSSGERGWINRQWRFARLWMARRERDVAKEMLPYLKDPDEGLRTRAVRALGRLEAPLAEAPLQKMLEQVQAAARQKPPINPPHPVPEVTLQLALGRIRSRGLKGQAKLEVVAKNVGLSYNEVLQLARKFHVKIKDKNAAVRQAVAASPGYEIIKEFVDVLYTMGKRGEDIQVLNTEPLAGAPVHRLLLKAATLPPEKEIEQALDYACQPGGGSYVQSYLVDLGPRATEMMIERLQHMLKHPELYRKGVPYGSGYVDLFRAAAQTGDPRMIPLLKQFEEQFKSSRGNYVAGYAQQARNDMESKRMFPIMPPGSGI